MKAFLSIFLFFASVAPGVGQHWHGTDPSIAAETFPGLGDYHHPITTKSREGPAFVWIVAESEGATRGRLEIEFNFKCYGWVAMEAST